MNKDPRHGPEGAAKHSARRKRIVRAGAPVPTERPEQQPPAATINAQAQTVVAGQEKTVPRSTSGAPELAVQPAPFGKAVPSPRAAPADYRGLAVGIGLAIVALVFFIVAGGGVGARRDQQPAQQAGASTGDDAVFAGIDRNDIGALMARGKELYDLNRFEDAARVYQQLVRVKPDSQAGHSNLGSAYFRMQRLPEALASFREAVRLNPNDAEARQNLAAGLAAMDDREGAIAEYYRALELKPDLPQPHYSLGVLYQLAGQNDKAIQALKRYLELGTDERLRADAQQRLQALGAR